MKKIFRQSAVFLLMGAIFFPYEAVRAFWSLSSVSGYGLPDSSLYSIIQGVLSFLLGIIGMVAVIGFLISGAMYILAAGDDKQVETAKSAMKNSIIGVIVALAGYVIVQAVARMLGGYTTF